MRRLSGVLLAGALLLLPVFSQSAAAQDEPQKFTLDGEVALWSVAIRGDRTADFEQVMTRVKEALAQMGTPEARQQAAGWKVLRNSTPQPDGSVVYTHMITPVPGADYTILQLLYSVFTDPAEQQKLYEMYSGAFANNFGASSYSVAVDMAQ